MTDVAGTKLKEGMIFEILKSAIGEVGAARIGTTSRGSVPHLTPDNVERHTTFGAAYLALEDFVERKEPPLYQLAKSTKPHEQPLRALTAFPRHITTILAARRVPPVSTPLGNGNKYVGISTSMGFKNMPVSEYCAAISALQPDVAIPLADLPHTATTPPSKKLVRMVERTEEWMNELLSTIKSTDGPSPLIFAPVLPVERPIQWQYLDHLAEGVVNSLSGLAIYDVDLIPELSHYESLQNLPRLLLQPPTSPRQVLRQVSLGADLIIAPFINASSDAGVAFSFAFPPAVPGPSSELLPLAVDMWTAEHSASLEPLMPGCSCYACSRHHRAFVQHLLNVKEMLGWTLLQIHNHHVVSEFFRGVRETLEKGTEVFEDAVNAFGRAYEAEFPPGTGQRPRARGYHFKSEGGDLPLNQKAWSKDVQAGISGQGSPTEGVEAVEAEMESMRV